MLYQDENLFWFLLFSKKLQMLIQVEIFFAFSSF